MTDEDVDPTTGAAAEPDADRPSSLLHASEFYDADSPPFGELPEKPKKAPAPPTDSVGMARPSGPHRTVPACVGALAVAAVAFVLLRRRRRARRA
jgi:hypothetical protein